MTRVLIIDDQAAILMLLHRILANAGYEVVQAGDGEAGVAAAAAGHFDVILTDLTMPGEPSGIELIRALRAAKPDCPIAILSGHHSDDSIAESRALGITDFIQKPFDINFIRKLVAEMLSRKAAAH